MSLTNTNPSSRWLLPSLFGRALTDAARPRTTGLRHAYVRDGLTSTVTVPGDWVEDPARWFATGTTYAAHDRQDVQLYVDGQETYDAMVEAMATATGAGGLIVLIGWACHSELVLSRDRARAGALANLTLGEILTNRNALGVKVRGVFFHQVSGVLGTIGALGGTALASSLYGVSGSEGESAAVTATATLIARLSNGKAFLDHTMRGGTGWRALPNSAGCHHQKIVLVHGDEGLVAFVGGVDAHPDRIQATTGGRPMHDVHCRIRGRTAEDILRLYQLRWNEGMAARGGDMWGIHLPQTWGRELEDATTIHATSRSVGRARVQINQTIGNPRIAAISGQHSNIFDAVARGCSHARRYIYVEDQYFWSQAAMDAIAAALPHVAQVIILINGEGVAEFASVRLTRTAVKRLVTQAGAHIDKVGIYERMGGLHSYVHSKMWIFDDELALVGSANCNRRGYQSDSESQAAFTNTHENGWATVEASLARKLRIRLWRHHLGDQIERTALHDAVASSAYWRERDSYVMDPAHGRVRPFRVDGQPWLQWMRDNNPWLDGADAIDPSA